MKKIFGKKFPRHAELVSASHESEIPNQVRNDVKRVSRAFTLAEVLITLLIIGVVAAITIPILMNNVNDKALSKQRDVTSKKFTEGLRQMRVDGVLNQKFATTQDFVNEMKKYFKINGTCNSDNLNGCFPAQTITGVFYDKDNADSNNETVYTVDNTLTPQKIGQESGQDYSTYDSFMGVTLQDGMSLLIAVNKDCIGPAEGETKDDSLMNCIGYIADVNNAKSPNKEGKDIYTNLMLSKAASTGPQIVGGVHGASEFCEGCTPWESDYWEAAKAFCETQGGHLPDNKELYDIAVAMGYNCPDSSDGLVDCEATDNLKPYGVLNPSSEFYLWSSVPDDEGSAYDRYFNTGYSGYGLNARNYIISSAICVR